MEKVGDLHLDPENDPVCQRVEEQDKKQMQWNWEIDKICNQFFNSTPFNSPGLNSFFSQPGNGYQSRTLPRNTRKAPGCDEGIVSFTSSTFRRDPEDNIYKVQFDMRGYDPDSISVKLDGDIIVIEANNFKIRSPTKVSKKEFYRRVSVPSYIDCSKLLSRLSKESKLSIEAPSPPSYSDVRQQKKLDSTLGSASNKESPDFHRTHSLPPPSYRSTINDGYRTLPAKSSHVSSRRTFHVDPTRSTHTLPSKSKFSNADSTKLSGRSPPKEPSYITKTPTRIINLSAKHRPRKKRLKSLSDSADSETALSSSPHSDDFHALSSSPSEDLFDVDSWFK